MSTCAICFEKISDSTLYPCRHIFCKECILYWSSKEYGTNCPTCRTLIYSIDYDKECNQEIVIDYPNQTISGVTITNCKDGIKIKKLNKKDQFYKCGLRKNNVIVTINNIPCKFHQNVISIINYHQLNALQMRINIIKNNHNYII